MNEFPIRTFTIVNTDDQTILHSPALPRPGVPYLDVPDSGATRLVVTTHAGAAREGVLRDSELRLTLDPAEFELLERRLMEAPREARGALFPYSVITEPPVVEFATDNERVVELVLPT